MTSRGKPLRTFEIIVSLLTNTRTRAGLRVTAKCAQKRYEKGFPITKEQMLTLSLHPAEFRGDWN